MRWEKKGLIFTKQHFPLWGKFSALQPTVLIIDNKIIRVYCGMRAEDGISRIGYVDLNIKDPSHILKISENPVLDIGIDGAFDDNGVVPSAVIEKEGIIYLFYAGYHLSNKVRFCVFSGLCKSTDKGETFERVQKNPFFERTDNELLFRVPHSVKYENKKWKFWYGSGSFFVEHNGKTLPSYDIKYLELDDLFSFKSEGKVVLTFSNSDEYRIARPYVIFDENIYKMYFCVSTFSKGYRLGYAESLDGVNWIRKDEELGFNETENEWDSLMMGYPSVIKTEFGTYMFYNGNNMGEDGFGYAVLAS